MLAIFLELSFAYLHFYIVIFGFFITLNLIHLKIIPLQIRRLWNFFLSFRHQVLSLFTPLLFSLTAHAWRINKFRDPSFKCIIISFRFLQVPLDSWFLLLGDIEFTCSISLFVCFKILTADLLDVKSRHIPVQRQFQLIELLLYIQLTCFYTFISYLIFTLKRKCLFSRHWHVIWLLQICFLNVPHIVV